MEISMLEEKLDALTKEVVALRQAIEKSGGLASTKTAEKAKAAPKGGKGKKDADEDEDDEDEDTSSKSSSKGGKGKKAPEPEHDEDEVSAMMRKAAKIDKPKVRKYIEKQDCEDLAELLTKPELFDKAYDFAEAIVEADEDDD
jgi:hypothetical protein